MIMGNYLYICLRNEPPVDSSGVTCVMIHVFIGVAILHVEHLFIICTNYCTCICDTN